MRETARSTGSRGRTRRRRSGGVAFLAAVGLACLLGLGYVAARETSLFALRAVVVTGAQPGVSLEVRRALSASEGASLLSLDPAAVEERLEAIPSVRRAEVDRRFPHTLQVTLVQERPVAVVRQDDRSWLVAASKRVIEEIELGALARLPRIWLDEDASAPEVGSRLAAGQGAAAAEVAAQVPAGFPMRIQSLRGTVDDVLLVLGGRTELRLGPALDVRRKLEAAAGVLDVLRRERARVAYVDVSLPERPVALEKSQLEGRA
jgi:cell division protein FtsQ